MASPPTKNLLGGTYTPLKEFKSSPSSPTPASPRNLLGGTYTPIRTRPLTPQAEEVDDTGALGQAWGSLMRGLSGGLASLPEAAAIAGSWIERKTGLDPSDKPEESLSWQLGGMIRSAGDWMSPAQSREYGDSFWATDLPQGIGSGLSFIVGGKGVGALVKGGISKSALKTGTSRALAKGATEKEAARLGAQFARRYPKMKPWKSAGKIAEKMPIIGKGGIVGGGAKWSPFYNIAATVDTASIAGLGAMMNATHGYQDAHDVLMAKAQAEGRTELNDKEMSTAFTSFLLNGGMGISEAMPMAGLLTRINQGTGGTFSKWLKYALLEGGTEFIQESSQTTWGNVVAGQLLKYDETREAFDHVLRSGSAGGMSGFLLSIFSSMIGGKVRQGKLVREFEAKAKELDAMGQHEQAKAMRQRADAERAKMGAGFGTEIDIDMAKVLEETIAAFEKDKGRAAVTEDREKREAALEERGKELSEETKPFKERERAKRRRKWLTDEQEKAWSNGKLFSIVGDRESGPWEEVEDADRTPEAGEFIPNEVTLRSLDTGKTRTVDNSEVLGWFDNLAEVDPGKPATLEEATPKGKPTGIIQRLKQVVLAEKDWESMNEGDLIPLLEGGDYGPGSEIEKEAQEVFGLAAQKFGLEVVVSSMGGGKLGLRIKNVEEAKAFLREHIKTKAEPDVTGGAVLDEPALAVDLSPEEKEGAAPITPEAGVVEEEVDLLEQGQANVLAILEDEFLWGEATQEEQDQALRLRERLDAAAPETELSEDLSWLSEKERAATLAEQEKRRAEYAVELEQRRLKEAQVGEYKPETAVTVIKKKTSDSGKVVTHYDLGGGKLRSHIKNPDGTTFRDTTYEFVFAEDEDGTIWRHTYQTDSKTGKIKEISSAIVEDTVPPTKIPAVADLGYSSTVAGTDSGLLKGAETLEQDTLARYPDQKIVRHTPETAEGLIGQEVTVQTGKDKYVTGVATELGPDKSGVPHIKIDGKFYPLQDLVDSSTAEVADDVALIEAQAEVLADMDEPVLWAMTSKEEKTKALRLQERIGAGEVTKEDLPKRLQWLAPNAAPEAIELAKPLYKYTKEGDKLVPEEVRSRIDLTKVEGKGVGGRVLRSDVERARTEEAKAKTKAEKEAFNKRYKPSSVKVGGFTAKKIEYTSTREARKEAQGKIKLDKVAEYLVTQEKKKSPRISKADVKAASKFLKDLTKATPITQEKGVDAVGAAEADKAEADKALATLEAQLAKAEREVKEEVLAHQRGAASMGWPATRLGRLKGKVADLAKQRDKAKEAADDAGVALENIKIAAAEARREKEAAIKEEGGTLSGETDVTLWTGRLSIGKGDARGVRLERTRINYKVSVETGKKRKDRRKQETPHTYTATGTADTKAYAPEIVVSDEKEFSTRAEAVAYRDSLDWRQDSRGGKRGPKKPNITKVRENKHVVERGRYYYPSKKGTPKETQKLTVQVERTGRQTEEIKKAAHKEARDKLKSEATAKGLENVRIKNVSHIKGKPDRYKVAGEAISERVDRQVDFWDYINLEGEIISLGRSTKEEALENLRGYIRKEGVKRSTRGHVASQSQRLEYRKAEAEKKSLEERRSAAKKKISLTYTKDKDHVVIGKLRDAVAELTMEGGEFHGVDVQFIRSEKALAAEWQHPVYVTIRTKQTTPTVSIWVHPQMLEKYVESGKGRSYASAAREEVRHLMDLQAVHSMINEAQKNNKSAPHGVKTVYAYLQVMYREIAKSKNGSRVIDHVIDQYGFNGFRENYKKGAYKARIALEYIRMVADSAQAVEVMQRDKGQRYTKATDVKVPIPHSEGKVTHVRIDNTHGLADFGHSGFMHSFWKTIQNKWKDFSAPFRVSEPYKEKGKWGWSVGVTRDIPAAIQHHLIAADAFIASKRRTDVITAGVVRYKPIIKGNKVVGNKVEQREKGSVVERDVTYIPDHSLLDYLDRIEVVGDPVKGHDYATQLGRIMIIARAWSETHWAGGKTQTAPTKDWAMKAQGKGQERKEWKALSDKQKKREIKNATDLSKAQVTTVGRVDSTEAYDFYLDKLARKLVTGINEQYGAAKEGETLEQFAKRHSRIQPENMTEKQIQEKLDRIREINEVSKTGVGPNWSSLKEGQQILLSPAQPIDRILIADGNTESNVKHDFIQKRILASTKPGHVKQRKTGTVFGIIDNAAVFTKMAGAEGEAYWSVKQVEEAMEWLANEQAERRVGGATVLTVGGGAQELPGEETQTEAEDEWVRPGYSAQIDTASQAARTDEDMIQEKMIDPDEYLYLLNDLLEKGEVTHEDAAVWNWLYLSPEGAQVIAGQSRPNWDSIATAMLWNIPVEGRPALSGDEIAAKINEMRENVAGKLREVMEKEQITSQGDVVPFGVSMDEGAPVVGRLPEGFGRFVAALTPSNWSATDTLEKMGLKPLAEAIDTFFNGKSDVTSRVTEGIEAIEHGGVKVVGEDEVGQSITRYFATENMAKDWIENYTQYEKDNRENSIKKLEENISTLGEQIANSRKMLKEAEQAHKKKKTDATKMALEQAEEWLSDFTNDLAANQKKLDALTKGTLKLVDPVTSELKYTKLDWAKAKSEFKAYMEMRENFADEDEKLVRRDAAELYLTKYGSPMFQDMMRWQKDTAGDTGLMLVENHVMVKQGKKWRPIMDLGEWHFPRVFTERTWLVLNNPNHPDNRDEYDRMLQLMVENGSAKDLKHAEEKLTPKEGEGKNEFFANIERARGFKLPAEFYDHSFEAYMTFLNRFGDNIARIEAFGQETEKTKTEWDLAMKGLGTRERKYIERLRDAVYRTRKEDDTIRNWFIDLGVPLTAAIYLSGPVTALRNTSFAISANMEHFGPINTFTASTKAAWEVAMAQLNYVRGKVMTNRPEFIAEARALDSLRIDAVDNHQFDLESDEEIAGARGKYKKFLQKNVLPTALWMQRVTERFNRGLTATLAKQHLRRTAELVQIDPDGTAAAQHVALITRQGYTGKQLKELLAPDEKGHWHFRSGNKTHRDFVRDMVNEKQYGYDVRQHPLFLDNPTSKIIFQFQKWAFQRSRDFARNIWRPARHKQKVTMPDGTVKEVRDFKPLVSSMFLMYGMGELYATLFMSLFYDRERKDAVIPMTEEDDERMFIAGERLWNDMTYWGGFGVFTEYANYFDPLDFRPAKWKSPMPHTPPSYSLFHDSAGMLMSLKEIMGSDEDLGMKKEAAGRVIEDHLKYKVPLGKSYYGLRWRALRAFDNEAEEIKIRNGEKDVKFARNIARRFAEEFGYDVNKVWEGGRSIKTEKGELYKQLAEANLSGNATKARLLRDRFIGGKVGNERSIALQGLKSSVRSRQPVLLDGKAPTTKVKNEFMRWARKVLDPAEYERIMDVHKLYKQTATRAGLGWK
jgi:hypothetical protein